MALFQKSIVEKYLEKIDESLIDRAYQNYSSIYVPKINRIKELTEEKYQTQFLQDIFGSVLGYTVDPDEGFNIELEKKNENDSKRVDGAIIKEDSVLGVIELKSTKTRDLEKVKDQAFGYKNNHKGCKYVISSNFHKLRFYVDDATEYEEFDLFNLSKSEFRKFYLYLRKEGLLDKDVPKLLKEETKFHEENISKKLYKDYSSFKNKVFENFVKNNPQHDKLILFKKSQKFLDRILFILFAEDKGLIPENAIPRIVKSWSEADDLQYKPLYDLFKIFFGHLNVGHKYKKTGYEIPAYNGGLFAPDKVLDNIIVDDEVLKDDLLILSKYDFNSEVDVNILGHIFEHSLSEIEEVEAELRGEVSDKSKSKRKKDGVFYTPKYITKYIVDNTIGKLCLDKRDELGIIDEEYVKGRKNRKKETIQTLSKNLEEYRNWLLKITICDPACGSGAFLNQALEFLIKEHQYIDELESQLLESPIVFNWVEDHILEKNLFGVDINEESAEIARLSLWLRTAKKGRKLTALNNNIKCGNSLIDDPEVAFDKAFNWQEEFPEIFKNGGFDVVIGNPPYVRIQNLDYEVIDWLKNNKESAYKRIDISTLFIEESLKLIKSNGLISFITSNQFFKAEYGRKLRDLIKHKLYLNIDYSDVSVFEGLATYVSIINLSNKKNDKIEYCRIEDLKQDVKYVESHFFDCNKLSSEAWDFNVNQEVKDKIYNGSSLLGDHTDFVYGIITGNDNSFIVSHDFAKKEKFEKGILLDFVKPENYIKYGVKKLDKYIIYPYNLENEIYSESELAQRFPNVFNFLTSNKDILENRKDSRVTIKSKGLDWYVIMRRVHPVDIEKDKIIFYDVGGHPNFYRDTEGFSFGGGTSHSLSIKENSDLSIEYLLAILNSKVLNWVIMDICPVKMGGARKYGLDYMRKLPIKLIDKEKQAPFIYSATELTKFTQNFLAIKNQFINYLQSQFSIEKLQKRLQNWHELEFGDFIKELNKAIKKAGGEKLGHKTQFKLMDLFDEQKVEAQALKAEIDKTDKEIDQMAYELYGLTEKEIKIVEES